MDKKIIQLTLTGYDHIPNFPGTPQIVKIQNNRKQSRICKTHITSGGVDDFWSFDWCRFFYSLVHWLQAVIGHDKKEDKQRT